MNKYYLKIEMRYHYDKVIHLDDGEYTDREYTSTIMHSDIYDDEKDCIALGNKLIEANRWIEQYPGYQNLKLERRLGYPLIAPSLKNGTQIFMSVKTLTIGGFDELDSLLKKFDKTRIVNKIK